MVHLKVDRYGPLQAGLQSSLKARLVIGPEGPMARRQAGLKAGLGHRYGPPEGGHRHVLGHGLRLNRDCIQSACQQTGTIIKPATCGLCLNHTSIQSTFQQAGTANRASNMACDWFTLLVNNLPANKRARQTASTTARLASRINLLSGFAEKFAETGLLVSSDAGPMACPVPGLSRYGLSEARNGRRLRRRRVRRR